MVKCVFLRNIIIIIIIISAHALGLLEMLLVKHVRCMRKVLNNHVSHTHRCVRIRVKMQAKTKAHDYFKERGNRI